MCNTFLRIYSTVSFDLCLCIYNIFVSCSHAVRIKVEYATTTYIFFSDPFNYHTLAQKNLYQCYITQALLHLFSVLSTFAFCIRVPSTKSFVVYIVYAFSRNYNEYFRTHSQTHTTAYSLFTQFFFIIPFYRLPPTHSSPKLRLSLIFAIGECCCCRLSAS